MSDLDQAIAHLGAALVQSIDSDDQIIMGHVRDAHDLAKRARAHITDVAQGPFESREDLAKAIAYELEDGAFHGARVTGPHLDNYHIYGHVNLLALAGAILRRAQPPAAPVEMDMVPKHLLDGRDDFIVSKGLWSEFMDSLPRAPVCRSSAETSGQEG